MAVSSGRYRHPANGGYSDRLKGLVDACLVVDPEQRPDINKVSFCQLLRSRVIWPRSRGKGHGAGAVGLDIGMTTS